MSLAGAEDLRYGEDGIVNLLVEEISVAMPNSRELVRLALRLLAACLFGAIIGYQRERMHKPAGLRTHMLVSLGSALFVLAGERYGFSVDALSRIIQGVATGIGFIGGGAILKMRSDHQVEGLTTAAGIWLTSAIGIAVGLGGLGLGLISVILAWIILAALFPLEKRIPRPPLPDEQGGAAT